MYPIPRPLVPSLRLNVSNFISGCGDLKCYCCHACLLCCTLEWNRAPSGTIESPLGLLGSIGQWSLLRPPSSREGRFANFEVVAGQPELELKSGSREIVKTIPYSPLASWGGKPVPKKSAGGKEGSIFSTLVRAPCCQIRALISAASQQVVWESCRLLLFWFWQNPFHHLCIKETKQLSLHKKLEISPKQLVHVWESDLRSLRREKNSNVVLASETANYLCRIICSCMQLYLDFQISKRQVQP